MSEATPRPWVISEIDPGDDGFQELEIVAPDSGWDTICTGIELTLPNAELIVRAVNCHDELVAALDQIVDIAQQTLPKKSTEEQLIGIALIQAVAEEAKARVAL